MSADSLEMRMAGAIGSARAVAAYIRIQAAHPYEGVLDRIDELAREIEQTLEAIWNQPAEVDGETA